MASRGLTDLQVGNLKPKAKEYEKPDPGAPGLSVKVCPSGLKVLVSRFWYGGRQEKITHGSYGAISLAAGRKLNADVRFALAQNINPAETKRRAKARAREEVEAARRVVAQQTNDDFKKWSEEYVTRYAMRETRPSSWKATQGIFRSYLLPSFEGLTVQEVTRRQVRELCLGIAEGRDDNPPLPTQANRVFAAGRHFYEWLKSEDVVTSSPFDGLKPPRKEKARERKLSDTEIIALWKACDELSPRHSAFVRLLLILGQRRSEVGNLPFAELDADKRRWEMPSLRTKNKQPHCVPLPMQAWDIIKSIPPSGDLKLVFGGQPDFGRIKRLVDAKLKLETPWALHDLRRTAASGLQQTGCAPHVIEQILNHRSGTFKGVTGVYQRHLYLPEMTAALQRWADHIERLVTGKADKNVLPMQRAR
jgi:integrase